MKKKILSILIFIVAIPAAVLLSMTVLRDVRHIALSLFVSVLSVVPFLLTFEKKEHSVTKLLLIAAMTALSVGGRLLFSAVPGLKPVTAMVIITGLYFGSEAGFLTGSMAALLSNFYFGQGPWTPFQMAAWGWIGFFAGLFREKLKKNPALLCVYGAAVGVLYSLVLDVEHAVYAEGVFVFSRYLAAVTASAGFTVLYAVSNVIFLLALTKPVGKILDRVIVKYGLET